MIAENWIWIGVAGYLLVVIIAWSYSTKYMDKYIYWPDSKNTAWLRVGCVFWPGAILWYILILMLDFYYAIKEFFHSVKIIFKKGN